jgi:co-chaperonin GroES (HSP10)
MSIKPWGNYVAVVDPPAEANDGTAGGIVLPPGVGLDTLDKAVVIGIGPCVEDNDHTPEGFGPGALVWYAHGSAFEIGRDSLKFVPANHLIAWEAAPVQEEVRR